mgnify:CR=1 FL=1
MNRDLFLSILALDSYSRGYGEKLAGLSSDAGTSLGNAVISKDSSILVDENGDLSAQSAGF